MEEIELWLDEWFSSQGLNLNKEKTEDDIYWEDNVNFFTLYIKRDRWYFMKEGGPIFVDNEFDIPIPNNKKDLFTVLNLLK